MAGDRTSVTAESNGWNIANAVVSNKPDNCTIVYWFLIILLCIVYSMLTYPPTVLRCRG